MGFDKGSQRDLNRLYVLVVLSKSRSLPFSNPCAAPEIGSFTFSASLQNDYKSRLRTRL
jgi:hypothetical protein